MKTRAEVLRDELAGLPGGTSGALIDQAAEWPLDEEGFAHLVVLIRLARRAGRSDEKQQRARNRASRVRDTGELAADTDRMVRRGLGRRAATDIEALGHLFQHYREGAEVLAMAVEGLRGHGWSDTDIGVAMGYAPEFARQEVHRRFGRREHDSAVREVTT